MPNAEHTNVYLVQREVTLRDRALAFARREGAGWTLEAVRIALAIAQTEHQAPGEALVEIADDVDGYLWVSFR